MSLLLKQVLAADVEIAPGTDFANLTTITIGSIVQGVITFALIAAALIFFFILVLGGIKWIMSEGDEAKVKSARDQVQNALIGLVITFAAWAILKLIENVFGLTITTGGFNFPTF